MKKWQKVLSAMFIAVVVGAGVGASSNTANAFVATSSSRVEGDITRSRAVGTARAQAGMWLRLQTRLYFVQGGQLSILQTAPWGVTESRGGTITTWTNWSTAPVNNVTSRITTLQVF